MHEQHILDFVLNLVTILGKIRLRLCLCRYPREERWQRAYRARGRCHSGARGGRTSHVGAPASRRRSVSFWDAATPLIVHTN